MTCTILNIFSACDFIKNISERKETPRYLCWNPWYDIKDIESLSQKYFSKLPNLIT